MRGMIRFFVAAVLAGLLGAAPVKAEVAEVRIVRQIGLGYLPLYVAQEKRLLEKHATAAILDHTILLAMISLDDHDARVTYDI